MLSIEPRSVLKRDEELAAVCVLASVCHAQQAFADVLQLEVLVFKLWAINRFAARAVAIRKVAALRHESGNDTVKLAVLVVQRLHAGTNSLLAGAERAKVLSRLWGHLIKELEREASRRIAIDCNVEKDLARFRGHDFRVGI